MTEQTDAPKPRKRRRRRKGRAQGDGDSTQDETPRSEKNTAPPPVVDDPETFALDQKFSDLGLSEAVQRALDEKGFAHPTLIQSQMIPFALEGKDVLGQARTGTGKTAAFGLPALGMIEEIVVLVAPPGGGVGRRNATPFASTGMLGKLAVAL